MNYEVSLDAQCIELRRWIIMCMTSFNFRNFEWTLTEKLIFIVDFN